MKIIYVEQKIMISNEKKKGERGEKKMISCPVINAVLSFNIPA